MSDKFDAKLNILTETLSKIMEKLEGLEEKVDCIDGKFDSVEGLLQNYVQATGEDFSKVKSRIAKVEEKLEEKPLNGTNGHS